MNINSISVLLGCAGLAIGGIGLLAQEIDRQPGDGGAVQSARPAWPPHALAAGVEYNDEMIELLTLGAKPRVRAELAQPAQAAPPEGDTSIRSIRMMRIGGSPRTRLVEIEFVDHDGRAYRRRYPIGPNTFAAGDARDLEAEQSALDANGYASRRSRRSGRGHNQRWWW